jgi:lactoylglutathione lyase
MGIKYLHTMVRVKDLEKSMAFYRLLGLEETRRHESEQGRFTLVFMAPPGQEDCPVELTYNWDGDDGLPSDSRHFGHLAYEVDDIYATCAHLQANGVLINRPPRDGRMAFVRSARQRVDRVVAGGARRPRRSPGRAWATPGTGEAKRPAPCRGAVCSGRFRLSWRPERLRLRRGLRRRSRLQRARARR